jgi:thioester reductase-like protein
MLQTNIESVYHAGALVNFAYSYSALKAANVLGTQEVLRLACGQRAKPVHFVSTLFVFPHADGSDLSLIGEEDDIAHEGVLYGGYAQSKWVAERLVTIARTRGLPVSIYRPGRITGHSRTGVWSPDDALYQLIKGWVQLGVVPEMGVDVKLDMTPVDYVSRAIVHLSLQKDSSGAAFHLLNPEPLPLGRLIEWMRSFGYRLRPISFEQWQTEVIGLVAKLVGKDGASLTAETLTLGKASVERLLTQVWRLRFDCRKTLDRLAGTPIVCPPIDDALLSTYFSSLIRSGFLVAPPSADNVEVIR